MACSVQARHAPQGRLLSFFYWLEHLEQLLTKHPDVRLLVHSSWRETYRPDEIAEMLSPLEGRFVGVAPPGPRGEAIVLWLRQHGQEARLLVIDDDGSEFPEHLGLHVLLCDPSKGLSAQSVQCALEVWLDSTS